jgi:hypothetical protein
MLIGLRIAGDKQNMRHFCAIWAHLCAIHVAWTRGLLINPDQSEVVSRDDSVEAP